MWNDTDVPLAIFFTFRTYGTWLHGDERGSVDRRRNKYGTPYWAESPAWKEHSESDLAQPPVILNPAMIRSVDKAIRGTCEIRSFGMRAINVRTNHAHSVISIGAKKPEVVRGVIKANATRRLREDGLWTSERSPWAHKGSCRRLWNERSVWEACDYVMNRQGADLTQYDWW